MIDDLHVKYRPVSFDLVFGQDEVCASIEEALEHKAGRSFLLTGPSGCGKTTIARLIAKRVGCDSSNLIEVDAATRTGVDAVRELQEAIRYTPMGGGVRMIVLDEAHMLSKAAWNALLKSIEEPPKGIYWAFCTTEAGKVPDTIKTRCLKYDLGLVEEEQIFELLGEIAEAEDLPTSEEVLDLVASKADGSPRQAITMLSTVARCESREEAALLLRVPGRDKEVIDLCRVLAKGTTWGSAMKILGKIDKATPESIRRQVLAYFQTAVMKSSGNKVGGFLEILEAFSEPYPQDSGMAPLLLSIGELCSDVD